MDIKAAVSAYNMAASAEQHDWQVAGLLAAAPHLQHAPAAPQLSGDVVRDACAAYSGLGGICSNVSHTGMERALQTVLERLDDHVSRNPDVHITTFVRTFRESILKPEEPTLEEAVSAYIKLQAPLFLDPLYQNKLAAQLVELVARHTKEQR